MGLVSPEFVKALKDVSVFLPELPQQDATDTLRRLEDLERQIAMGEGEPRNLVLADYIQGSAAESDELGVYGPQDSMTLVSADHATDTFNRKRNKFMPADHGTGGLAKLMSERRSVTSIIPLGQQTWNVAMATDDHPIKVRMGRLLPGKQGFISLHGMYAGKLLDPEEDKTEIHGLIGLGLTPNVQSRMIAERIVQKAGDIGLRVLIGNDTTYRTYDPSTEGYELDTKTGRPKEAQLMARSPHMTTNYAYRNMAVTGRQMPSIQLELTRLLRLLPSDLEGGWHSDQKARAMGVHLGYLLTEAAVKAIEQFSIT